MRSRYTIRELGVPYFITFTVVKWIPIFTRKPYFDILIDTLRFCRQYKDLKVYAYVILDNHLHLVVAGDKLTDIIRDFKSYTAKLLIARLEQDQKTKVLIPSYAHRSKKRLYPVGAHLRVRPWPGRTHRSAPTRNKLPI
jgi:REP element-mobilizing transposase RayT